MSEFNPISTLADSEVTSRPPEMVDVITSLKVMALDLHNMAKVMQALANFLIEKNQKNEI
jgi:major membrane immunogen (membrane-anchored lipoprotein)